MAERGIIFSAPMVRALLDGRKTQTRRIAKITAIMGNRVAVDHPEEKLVELGDGEFRSGVCHYVSTGALSGPYSLPAAVGDRLWVRENWRGIKRFDEVKPSALPPSMIAYEADQPYPFAANGACVDRGGRAGKLRPGRFMPRWASRLTLLVTDVRVQRLQEISEEDARTEGTPSFHEAGRNPVVHTARDEFSYLWDRLHGAHAWDANPWVAAISFDVQWRNIDAPSQPGEEA